MSDPISEFLERLGRRGREPWLSKVTGSVRIDVLDGPRPDHWLVAIERGNITVSHSDGDADCDIQASRQLIEAMISGKANAMAAVLRGAVVCHGDVELLFAVQRLFPGPEAAEDRRASVSPSDG